MLGLSPMEKSRIINNKSISILALIFATIGAVPDIWRNPNLFLFLSTILWTISAIFTWMDKKWAVYLLGGLALYDLFKDIIFEIPKFKQSVNEFSFYVDNLGQYVPYIIILSMVVEAMFLFCFIYYSFYIFNSHLGSP